MYPIEVQCGQPSLVVPSQQDVVHTVKVALTQSQHPAVLARGAAQVTAKHWAVTRGGGRVVTRSGQEQGRTVWNPPWENKSLGLQKENPSMSAFFKVRNRAVPNCVVAVC